LRNSYRVTITTHDDYPMRSSLQGAADLDGLNSDLSGNSDDYIDIMDNSVINPMTIGEINVPLLISDVIDITNELTILEGTEIVIRENAGLGVYDNGILKIQGTDSRNVIIRGYESVAGYWRGIHIESSSLNNIIDYAEISDAGSNYVYCCNDAASIFYKAGYASITNTKISNGKSYGIYAGKNFYFDEFANNTITTHEKAPMYIAAERIVNWMVWGLIIEEITAKIILEYLIQILSMTFYGLRRTLAIYRMVRS
jgi:hypothetical protein